MLWRNGRRSKSSRSAGSPLNGLTWVVEKGKGGGGEKEVERSAKEAKQEWGDKP